MLSLGNDPLKYHYEPCKTDAKSPTIAEQVEVFVAGP